MQPSSLILVLLLGGMLFLMFSRTRRQQREAQSLQSRLTEGSRVVTTAGLYATVVQLEDTSVTLETAPGQRSRWDRRAIARVLTDDEADRAEPVAPTGDTEPVEGTEPVEERSLLAEPGVNPDPVERAVDEAAKHSSPPDRA